MQEWQCQITNGSLGNLNLIKSNEETVVFQTGEGFNSYDFSSFPKSKKSSKFTFAGNNKSK